MKLTVNPIVITAIFGLWAGTAQAAITVQDVVSSFQDAAYTGIEVKEGPTQIKVEAFKDGVKVEVVYDKATGTELKRESEAAETTVGGTGVEVAATDDDFTDEDNQHHGIGDDSADDNVSDDGYSHQSGSDDGVDHDAGDDNSGADHAGSGHDDNGHDSGHEDSEQEGTGHDSGHDDRSDD